MLRRSRGHPHVANAVGNEMPRSQFGHLAGANQQHGLVSEVRKNLFCEFNSRVAYGHRRFRDFRVSPYPFRHRNGFFDDLVENQTG